MTFSLLHLGDLHFGGPADLTKIEALESLIPDLEPRAIVIAGDLTQRARHGEFQRARTFIREAERTAPVFVLPGNHDVEWWKRPLVPFSTGAKYCKYRTYLGPVPAATMEFPEAIIAGVITAHGLSWGSLSFNPRQWAVRGHLPKKEIHRVSEIFGRARSGQARILVVHHNVLRGKTSNRPGLVRWRRAQKRIFESGAELVLCGHDHEDSLEVLGDRVLVACAGSPTKPERAACPTAFFRITVDDTAIRVEVQAWDRERQLFRRTEESIFARARALSETPVGSPVG